MNFLLPSSGFSQVFFSNPNMTYMTAREGFRLSPKSVPGVPATDFKDSPPRVSTANATRFGQYFVKVSGILAKVLKWVSEKDHITFEVCMQPASKVF